MSTMEDTRPTIAEAVQALGGGPLTEESVRDAIWPLFSRTLDRPSHPKLNGRPEVYLANHSLGRPLDQTARDLQRAMDLWYRDMDGAWVGDDGWMAEIATYRRLMAELVGARRPDCIVPKTSAGQGLRAVLNAISDNGHVPTVVATRGEFDSCDFILKAYHAKGRARVRWVEPAATSPFGRYRAEDVIKAIDGDVDLVLCSQVIFSTGEVLAGLPEITRAAHDHDALMIVDTYHSAGVMPINIDGDGPGGMGGADFAIGGNYKYTRGGPGACWLAVHPRHLSDENAEQHPSDRLSTLDTGWFAKKDTFSYRRTDAPELSAGGDAWLESTPPIMTAYQARSGLELTLGIGLDRMRAYNLHQQALLRRAFENRGVKLYTPDASDSFGGFALLVHDEAPAVSDQLRVEGVNTDARGGCVRFGPDLLSTQDEFELAADIVARVLG